MIKLKEVIVVNNKGYTVIDVIIIGVILGVVTILTINKVSYAFEDTSAIAKETQDKIILKSSEVYAQSIKDTLKEEKTKYILASDLIEAGYLAENEDYKNYKVKIEYNEETDSVLAELID